MSESRANEVAIVGAGIAGLAFGLLLHARGIPCRIYERVDKIEPLGVGINVLPHAARVLDDLGLGADLEARAILARESAFFNRFGQLIYKEPLGRDAGYPSPQYSIHRGDLQRVLLDAFIDRVGGDRLILDAACIGAEQTGDEATLRLQRTSTGEPLPPASAALAVACDGVNSVIRKQLHPHEGKPNYIGFNMWRGVTRHPPILTGATMIRVGWLETGKMVIYPIRDDIDGDGNQLINWVAELAVAEQLDERDWNREGRLADFMPAFEDWHFDWLDAPTLIRSADRILEFPMVDQDPLPFWTKGRITLMGDAAHPMVPRGSNGAGQAILDAECLADELARSADHASALKAYEDKRLEATSRVVLTNRVAPPDILIKEIVDRTGDKPFDNIDDVISEAELAEIQRRYKEISGYDLETLRARAGL